MPIIKLNKRAVDAAQRGPRDAFLWDADLAGFGLKVTPAGGKVYIVQYRAGGRGTPTRRVTIGRHGSPWTPDAARREARRLLGEVAAGGDPAVARRAEKAKPTVAELVVRFLAEHVEAKRKTRTADEYRRLCDKFILPELGRRRVDEVTRAEVARLHHRLKETPYQANRVLAVLSKLFNWAERHGLRPDGSNLCRHVERFQEAARERFLSAAELACLGEALAAAERDGSATPWMIGAIRLLVFTGARLNEILTARWEWVDAERGTLSLPDSKTGRKVIHLNPPALAVLAGLPRVEDNPYIVAGRKRRAHLVNLELVWRRIRERATVRLWARDHDPRVAGLVEELRAAKPNEEECTAKEDRPRCAEVRAAAEERGIRLPVGLADVRLHDLRHSFASVAAARGLSLPVIGAMLGHAQPATTARYAHLANDPIRAASEAVAAEIAAAMGMADAGGAVAPVARRK